MAVQTYQGTLTIVECARCHMDFGVTPAFERARRADHGSFYCPAGHVNYWPQKSEAEKLREKLAAEEARAARAWAAADQAQAEADHQAARVRGYQGALAKSKKRQAKGVCPVPGCRRHFADVERHVASKHPDYLAEQS